MSAALLSLATQIGAPIVSRVLANKIGPAGAALAGEVLQAVAQRAGVAPDELDAVADATPDLVVGAIREVEQIAPGMVALHTLLAEEQFKLQHAELNKEHWIAWAWRPLWMMLLGLLWVWTLIVAHLLNAVWKWALPTDAATLMALTGLFLTLYMGGHTVKDAISKWTGAR
ncbi:hypothetical protein [uncultured Tateyamaria sp.]|uniref:hypothetical protein n=1 Tax=uncultured Tateyamaria sp. TaxID=455651 RepID=UPI00261E68D4|nr:hypothetical protein [uncultured Tateyamaria sp.]